MAIEIEKHELRSYEIRKQKHKKKVITLLIISTFVVIAIGAFIINLFLNKNYTSYQVIHTTKKNDSNSAQYLSYGSSILRYSRDGAMAMDSAGNPLWDGTYEMNDPIIDICGKYVAIGDRGYKTVQIYDGSSSYQINVLKPIIKVEVANQGVVAVLMDDKEVNYFEVFNKEGEVLVDGRTKNQEDGFPIDIDLSDDGKKMVTSYAAFNNGAVQNKVTFYNFDEVGKNYESRIVYADNFGQTLVPDVEFINNNTVCAFGDDKCRIYSMEKIPKQVSEVTLPSEIKSTFYTDESIGFVVGNTDGENPYRVMLYDLKGKLKLNKTMNYNYDKIFMSGDDIIMYSNLEWIIWKVNGKEKFHYTFDSNVFCILPVNNFDRYILVNNQSLDEVKLIEKR